MSLGMDPETVKEMNEPCSHLGCGELAIVRRRLGNPPDVTYEYLCPKHYEDSLYGPTPSAKPVIK